MSPSRRTVSPARVLIVEDEASVCDLLDDLLSDEGYETECVRSDAEAYRALDRDRGNFVVLVVDIDLGRGTTGFDVARHARRLNPAIPVVYITGTSLRSLGAHGVDGGVLVPKPFDRGMLIGAVEDRMNPSGRPESQAAG
jgi:DNA-binding response OmpR family regulator